MKEVRPGIVMVRRTKKNKIKALTKKVLEEKGQIEQDIQDKFQRGKEAVNALQAFAEKVNGYVELLKERGIDAEYIKNNAEQIHTIFFAVLELIENGEKGFKEKSDGK
jgi:hypothetical protein